MKNFLRPLHRLFPKRRFHLHFEMLRKMCRDSDLKFVCFADPNPRTKTRISESWINPRTLTEADYAHSHDENCPTVLLSYSFQQFCSHNTLLFKSNARETWCVILVSESWHILLRITAHPRGAFISVGDCTPTEKDLLLLTTCRSGSLLDWDKSLNSSFFLVVKRITGTLKSQWNRQS